jgi:hypothetical protein
MSTMYMSWRFVCRLSSKDGPRPLRRLSCSSTVAGAGARAPMPPAPAALGVKLDPLGALPLHVRHAARAVTAQLEAAGLPCAVAGAVACNAHGHQRATRDVDVLVNARDTDKVRHVLLDRGWSARFPGARKLLHDTANAVNVNILRSGEFPGSWQPKPVAFPELSQDSLDVVVVDGVRFVTLPKLIELKLASGTSLFPCSKEYPDLADVYALIKANSLPLAYVYELHISVRVAYCKIWRDWNESGTSGTDPKP